MPPLAVDGATVVFEPDPGAWSWKEWKGEVRLSVTDQTVASEGHAAAIDVDFVALAKELLGKPYTATGFADTPGSVLTAVVMVDKSSMSGKTTRRGSPVATAQTKGKFTVACMPAMSTKTTPPTPDPVPTKTGSWRIEDPGQSKLESA